MNPLIPGQDVPDLAFDTVTGGHWHLADQRPPLLTLIVFYRGGHCPFCCRYLQSLNALAPQFRDLGIEPIAASADTCERALKAQQEWGIEDVSLGYGLQLATMRSWGLFVSRAVRREEPLVFCEPGLFCVRTDQTLYCSVINSMAYARPNLHELLENLDVAIDQRHPPRGQATVDQKDGSHANEQCVEGGRPQRIRFDFPVDGL